LPHPSLILLPLTNQQGGEILESAIEMMNDFGRIIACGSISGYDRPMEQMYGVRNLFHVVAKRITFQGFVTDTNSFTQQQFQDATIQIGKWLKSGDLKDTFTVVDGFERTPEALEGLFKGKNTGKMMVRCKLPTELASATSKL
jgi:NADPH-dependent curcumin reductase CurA